MNYLRLGLILAIVIGVRILFVFSPDFTTDFSLVNDVIVIGLFLPTLYIVTGFLIPFLAFTFIKGHLARILIAILLISLPVAISIMFMQKEYSFATVLICLTSFIPTLIAWFIIIAVKSFQLSKKASQSAKEL